MSEHQPEAYTLDNTQTAKEQIRAIAAYAKTIGKSRELGRIMRKAIHMLQSDPHGWGDPEYRSKVVDAVACRGILRPVVFHYVIYEQVRGVILLSVRLYADFD